MQTMNVRPTHRARCLCVGFDEKIYVAEYDANLFKGVIEE